MLFTVFGPHHDDLTPHALRRDIDAVRQRLESSDLRPETAYDIVTAIRLALLQANEDLVTTRAALIGQLELEVIRVEAIRRRGDAG